MTPDERNDFEALAHLRRAAWESFDGRRRSEWQVTLALWTSLASFLAFFLTRQHQAVDLPTKLVIAFTGVLIFVLHYRWLGGVMRGHRIEQEKAKIWEDRMAAKFRVDFKTVKTLQDDIRNVNNDWSKRGFRRMLHWNPAFHWGVTLAFCLAVVTAVCRA